MKKAIVYQMALLMAMLPLSSTAETTLKAEYRTCNAARMECINSNKDKVQIDRKGLKSMPASVIQECNNAHQECIRATRKRSQ